jgi:hypothetical protein
VPVPGPPPIDVAAVRSYCEQRVPPHALHQVRVEAIVDGNTVTIVERRAPWRPDFGPEWTTGPIARLRYVHKERQWRLLWRDRNQHWHHYDLVKPTADVTVLIDEVELLDEPLSHIGSSKIRIGEAERANAGRGQGLEFSRAIADLVVLH